MSNKITKSIKTVLFVLMFFSFQKTFSQTAEVFSGRIKPSQNEYAFYFRILNVDQATFNAYASKCKQYAGMENYKNGYSSEYQIGSLYFKSNTQITLVNIQSLLKLLGFAEVLYDGKKIQVSELHNQQVVTIERPANNSSIRNK